MNLETHIHKISEKDIVLLFFQTVDYLLDILE